MSKNTIAAKKIQERIQQAIADNSNTLSASFNIEDGSVQAEQRLRCNWSVRYKADYLGWKKDLANTAESQELWADFEKFTAKIRLAALVAKNIAAQKNPIKEKIKAGHALREEAKAEFILKSGREFLAAIKSALGKKKIKEFSALVAEIQETQKILLSAMRTSNAEYMAEKKHAKARQRSTDATALASGIFWNASRDAIKDYFNPPFEKNYLADVSEKWRAALFTECESTGYKSAYGWRHKLVGTGRGYLCGIDDNGDEWGHVVDLPLDIDQYGNKSMDAKVEDAMAELFDVSASKLERCHRQGDLLFRPCSIIKQAKVVCAHCGETKDKHPETAFGLACYNDHDCLSGTYSEQIIEPPHLEIEKEWRVRESHVIKADSLRHNGKYFAAEEDIQVEHTSHQTVVLPAGEWCLHTINIVDAD